MGWIWQCIKTTTLKLFSMVERDQDCFPKGVFDKVTLSPYIVIIYDEYLWRYIHFTANRKLSSGVRLNKDTPKISYLIFADDCIIFCRTNKSAARNIKQILDHYCMVSGHLINYQKSRVQFFKDVSNADKMEPSQILQIPSSNKIGTYLGWSEQKD